MDCSEITKGSVFTKRSTKEKRVSWDKTINCTNKPSEPPDMEEEDDEFEKEMRTVIEERLHKAEVESGIKSKYQTPNTVGKVNSKTDIDDNKNVYDPIYFDSDDSDEENDFETLPSTSNSKTTKNKEHSVVSTEDLMYGPELDDEDQAWADNIRKSYQRTGSQKSGIPLDNPKPLKNSSAVLNCPACFVVLCIDCQQHEKYHHQFRAMFVMNCKEDTSQKLTFPLPKSKSKGKAKASKMQAEFNNELDPEEVFNPVKCAQCSTQVAVYDTEEVYHFFNVLASQS